MVEDDTTEVDGGLSIQVHFEVIEGDDGVALTMLREVEDVGQPRTASTLDTQAKPETLVLWCGEEASDLGARCVGEVDQFPVVDFDLHGSWPLWI